ncbi:MAG: EthD domain-containing protein, partial [Deltaproteobacteria bacterium]|nr:EthD domain-containing protein [Deltaproteobacteria bacterium]
QPVEKLIYLLGETEAGVVPKGRRDLRNALLAAAATLRRAGARELTFSVADVDDPDAGDVTQFNRMGLLDAQLSLWVDNLDARGEIESIVAKLAPRRAGYLVTESILREYDGRDWSPGHPSPGIALVTTFPKPDAIDDETFFARWHGSHGPLSLELHPLTRYVRNAVARALTPAAPPIRAIVSESVASAAVAADVEQFYGGRENRERIVKDLFSFAELESMSAVVMREYILEA